MKLHHPGLLLLFPLLSACGDGPTEAHEAGPAAISEADAGHRLSLTVDGARFDAKGHPFGPAVHFGGREINVQVGGPLTSAVAAGEDVSLGDADLIANVLANDIEPGTYALVASQISVTRSPERIGFAEFFFPESSPFRHLRPVSGTLKIETVKGQEDDRRYRLQRVIGRVEGKFIDKTFTEHSVEGTFEYTR